MSLVIAILAWVFIGAIVGLVVPMIAGTYARDRVVRMCALGAVIAVAAGLAAYLVNSLFDDASSTFYGVGSGVLAVVTFISLLMYEKRRTSRERESQRDECIPA